MKTKERITSVILVLALLLVSVVCPAITASAGTVAEGECGAAGSNVNWTLSNTGDLVISGTGKMKNGDSGLWGDNKSKIKTVTINEGVTFISSQAFGYCGNLVSVSLPASLEEIAGYAFVHCENLKTITIASGSKLKKLGHEVFIYCRSIEEINIPKSLQTIPDNNFNTLNGLKNIYVESGSSYFSDRDGVLYNADGRTLIWYPQARTAGVYRIPDGVETIGQDVFETNTHLFFVQLPDSVTTIGEHALTHVIKEGFAVTCGRDTPAEAYAKANGIKYYYNDETAVGECGKEVGSVWWLLNRTTGLLTIGGSGKMDTFDDYAPGWTYLRDEVKSVKIENGITDVGATAFFRCENLTKVDLPATITAIGDSAFNTCVSLTDINIPKAVTSIGDKAFYNCTALERLEIRETVTTIGSRIFQNCSKLKVKCLPGSRIGNYCNNNGISCIYERDCLNNSFETREFAPKTFVTAYVSVSDLPFGAEVYIDGKKAERESDASTYYRMDFGQVEELNCEVEVKLNGSVLDKGVIKAQQEKGFFALLRSFFENFLFNGFKWGNDEVRFW